MSQRKKNAVPEDTAGLIRYFADLRGIAGREGQAGAAAAEAFRGILPDAAYENGNVTAHLRSGEKKPVLLLCAHMDQVGFLVTDITPDGFLRIGAVGGIDRRILSGQAVTVFGTASGKTVPLPGIIAILPPHLTDGNQAVPEITQLCVDLGFSSEEETKRLVAQGDALCFAAKSDLLGGNCVTAPALDDRCGIAILYLTAKALAAEENLPCNVTFVCSAQEERGGRGAVLAARQERYDAAIAVDATFGAAADAQAGCFALGSGPAVGISPVLSEALSEKLLQIAERCGDYSREVMSGRTGTDADQLALSPDGAAAGTVSFPLRNMHTPAEAVSTEDADACVRLLTEFAKEYGR